MGDIYIALGSGGGTSSSDVTATKDKVLSGYTAMTADSDDEPINGALVDRGAWNGSVAMNRSITIPKGYHNGIGTVAGPSVTQRGAWATNIGINGSVTIPQGYHNGSGKVTQSIATLGGQTITPSKSIQTVSCSGKYMTGNVTVGAIPSNFVDLTGGRVGFNETAFYSPLDGGVRSNMSESTTAGMFIGVSSYAGEYGIRTIVYRDKTFRFVCNHSVNLTGVRSIRINAFGDSDSKYCEYSVIIYSINKRLLAQKVHQNDTNKYVEFVIDVSGINEHAFIEFAPGLNIYSSRTSVNILIRKITFEQLNLLQTTPAFPYGPADGRSGTFKVPANVYKIEVFCVRGGGHGQNGWKGSSNGGCNPAGGAGGGESGSDVGHNGGSDGSNGGGYYGGIGQGRTTRAFGKSTGTLYAGGGGGGTAAFYEPEAKGGDGGSGIAIIPWGYK